MAASDGTYRANYGANVSLPWNIGSVWYSHEQLSSGKFLDIYENKGNTGHRSACRRLACRPPAT